MQIASWYETERTVCESPESLSSTCLLSRRSADCVEKILAASILCQAVEDLQKFHYQRRGAGEMLYRKVVDWIASNDRSSPYSFLNLCDVLGVAPDRLRGELLAANSTACAVTVSRIKEKNPKLPEIKLSEISSRRLEKEKGK